TGMLLLVPATQWVLERSSDWRDGYHFQAAVAALLVPIVILMPFRRIAIEHPAPTRTATAGGPSFRAALSTRAFWGLTGVYFWTSAAMFAIAPQIVAYLIEIGFEPLFAASAFGIAGFLSAIGIFGAGWLSDRIGQPRVVSISFALSILGLLLLMALGASPNLILLTAFIVVYGLTTGTRGPIVSSMAARLFAGARLGAIYGAMTAGYGIGAALGAFLGGVLFDLTGGYQAVILYAVACLVGGYSAFLLLPREHRRS
ncbi:MAG: MFS transporter, partial [Alphaproteobacteria bacterium]|nr:MFS transporter [Alphaproteobacteria bacterium]